jgi:hypothetical protein
MIRTSALSFASFWLRLTGVALICSQSAKADVDAGVIALSAGGVQLLQLALVGALVAPKRMSGSRASASALCGGLYLAVWIVVPGIGHNVYLMWIPAAIVSVVIFSLMFLYYEKTRL